MEKRRPNGRFDAETPQRGLRTVMAGPDGDSFQIEQPADVFGVAIRQHERQHADLFAGRADQPQAVDARELLGGVFEQFVLVLGDVRQPEAVDVIERGAQADGVGDVRRAGLELGRAASA